MNSQQPHDSVSPYTGTGILLLLAGASGPTCAERELSMVALWQSPSCMRTCITHLMHGVYHVCGLG